MTNFIFTQLSVINANQDQKNVVNIKTTLNQFKVVGNHFRLFCDAINILFTIPQVLWYLIFDNKYFNAWINICFILLLMKFFCPSIFYISITVIWESFLRYISTMSYQISKRLISDVAVKNTEIFFILGTINLIQSYCAEVFENPSSHSIKNEKSDTGESFYSISFNFCWKTWDS